MIIYFFAVPVAVLLYAFHFPGLDGYYMDIWWYDIFMHILGGLASGLLFCSVLRLFRINLAHPRRYIVLAALILGLIWEAIEIAYNMTGYPIGSRLYYIDTIIDVIDDIIGGFIAAYLFIKLRNRDMS